MQSTPVRRNFCSQLVSIIRCQADGPQPVIQGNLEEITESSALVLTDSSIRPGTKVRINCNMRELRGIAESCKVNDWLGCFVEIRLDADSRWSPRWFLPEHFLTVGCQPGLEYSA